MFKNSYKAIALACVSLASLCLPLPAQTLPQLGVFRWSAPGGCNNVDAYSNWLAQQDMWAEDFEEKDTWYNIMGPSWILDPWKDWVAARPGRRLILGVPMLPNAHGEVSLETGATGAYNAYYRTLAEKLVAKNLGNTIIRLGWEFNGGWYKWAANGKQAAFAAYWQQIVTTMRAVPGTQNLKFCFNPVYGYQQFPAEQAYPGDAYVDYIALDVYDESWQANTYPWPAGSTAAQIEAARAEAWWHLNQGNHGLVYWKNFAATHGKPFAIGEWGVNHRSDGHSGEDNPQFVTNMYNFITTPSNNVAWAVYFDVQASDGHHQLSPSTSGTDYPLARARFLELFKGTAFQYVDIGGSTPAGSGSTLSGVSTVKGGGNSIWGTSDQLTYYQKVKSGNITFQARLTGVSNTNANTNAGVMLRASTASNSQYIMLLSKPNGALEFRVRASTGANTYYSSANTGVIPSTATPIWLRIVKNGQSYNGYYSTSVGSPTVWTSLGSTWLSTNLPASYHAGLAVHSHTTSGLATAVFDNVTQ